MVCSWILNFTLGCCPLNTQTAFTASTTSSANAPPSSPSSPILKNSKAPSPGRGSHSRGAGRLNRGRVRHCSMAASNNGTSADVVCYKCGQPYNKANQCWAPDSVVESPKAFHAMSISLAVDDAWYLDSGATHNLSLNTPDVSGKHP